MMYLIPEFILIFCVLAFTEEYITLCIGIFNVFFQFSSLSFFKYSFLAFPITNLLIFSFLGYLRHVLLNSRNVEPTGIQGFLKENFIFIVVVMVFVLRTVEALNDTSIFSPYWPNQLSKTSLLFDLGSTFCLSSVILHILFQIKRLFQNRSI